jgi:integrase
VERDMNLSDLTIKSLKPKEKTFKRFDGGGLFIEIATTGGKLWRFKYRFDGKEKLLALGRYPEVSLQEARRRHFDAREKLSKGIDPSAEKKAIKAARCETAANTFEAIALEWHARWKKDRAEKYGRNVLACLKKEVFPYIGAKPVSEIKAPDVLGVCRRIEKRSALQATRMANTAISQIIRYAIVTGRAEYDPCPGLRGALETAHATPHPTFTDPERIGELMRAIDQLKGNHIVRSALALAPLVFVRPVELRMAKWADFDLEKAEWVFEYSKQRCAARTKRKLVVPLARQAVEILKDLHPMTGQGVYVFPGFFKGDYLPEHSINRAIRGMGYDTKTEISAHGFRALARTVLAERLRFPAEWIERQLSHITSERLGEAYDRTQYLDDRKEMMQRWADYLYDLKEGKTAAP